MPQNNLDILTARARAMAAPNRPRDTAETVETVAFVLANETYGIERRWVREVLPLGGVTFIPGLPAYIAGIINVRGEIVSVMDLKHLFGLPAADVPVRQYVLILAAPDMTFGVLADQILGMRNIPMGALQTSLPTLTGIRAVYLKGLDPAGLIMLDGHKLLTDESLQVCQEME